MEPVTMMALAGLAGAYLNSRSQTDANNKNVAATKEANADNIALQREFAQNGIQWKLEDARKAGINPLMGLGAPTTSFSPTVMGPQVAPDTSWGDALSNMGQNVSRAAMAAQTQEERAFTEGMRVEQYKNAQLQNKLLESQIVNMNQRSQLGPPMPSGMLGVNTSMADQGDVALKMGNRVQIKPATKVASMPGQPQTDAGYITDYSFARTKNGFAVVPSEQMKERIEDNIFQEVPWAIRNQIMPNLSSDAVSPPPKSWLPKGAQGWKWDYFSQSFRPYKKSYDKYNLSGIDWVPMQ